jgi:hypothetical protein
VLKLNVTKTVELFLVTIGNKSEGIEEAERRLSSKFVLEGLQGGGGSSLLGRSKSGGGGNKGGENSRLHLDLVLGEIMRKSDVPPGIGMRSPQQIFRDQLLQHSVVATYVVRRREKGVLSIFRQDTYSTGTGGRAFYIRVSF